MQRKSYRQLLIPIMIELILTVLIGSIDTFMLSAVGDDLVGAVGTANSYSYLITILFSVISGGLAAVMSQYIGAKYESSANRAHFLALIINIIFGLILSVSMFFGTSALLQALDVASNIIEYSTKYLWIIGSFLFIDALTPIFSAYLRSYGKTKYPMISTGVMNVVNVSFNALFIYTRTCPMDAVRGVAISSVIAKFCGLSLNVIFYFIYRNKDKTKPQLSDKQILKDIVRIGLPGALETIIFNLVMAFITTCLNHMDDDGFYVTAYTYCNQITYFGYVMCIAMSQANAIKVGWFIGEKRFDECKKFTLRVLLFAMIISIVSATILALFGRLLLSIFTDNETIIGIGVAILFVDIILELGRSVNLTIGNALKAAGDATFTVIIGIVFMVLVAGGGSYILGTTLKWYALGVWIAKACDEIIRGILMFLRWKSDKWKTKVLIKE